MTKLPDMPRIDPPHWTKMGNGHYRCRVNGMWFSLRRIGFVDGRSAWILWGFPEPTGLLIGGSLEKALDAAFKYLNEHA